MKKNRIVGKTNYEKDFLDKFEKLCVYRSSWQVWADLISVMACAINNSIGKTALHYEEREKEYMECMNRFENSEIPAQILAIIVMAYEENPEQDFLGKMYMALNLGNHWKGQFFTPYNVSRLMADVQVDSMIEQINTKGWVSICDPCVGGAAMLLAAANSLREKNINYQNHALFVGQDIDRVTAQMAYIQISLLGCAGYIVVGNSLTNPMTGEVLFPSENSGQELWLTPMFCSDIWTYRKLFNML